MRWIPRRRKKAVVPATPVVVSIGDWPTQQLQVLHKHEYGQRPRPAQARSFQAWLEVNGSPITARISFPTWGSGAHFSLTQYWRHLFTEYNDHTELGQIDLRVEAYD